MMATATDLTGSVTGVFTKPVEEWRYDRRQRVGALRKQSNSATVHRHRKGELGGGIPEPHTSAESEPAGINRSTHQGSLAGRMAGASAKSIGNFVPTALKGMMVDVPLAITEGLRSMPNYYGGAVRDNGKVTDAKSGAVVAGKSFAWGFIDGLSDVVVQPYMGARKDGAVGAVKGFGKGVASLATKSGAGMFGVFAYPSAGISKSLRAVVHSRTRKEIALQRHKEGVWMIETGRVEQVNTDEVVSAFIRLRESWDASGRDSGTWSSLFMYL